MILLKYFIVHGCLQVHRMIHLAGHWITMIDDQNIEVTAASLSQTGESSSQTKYRFSHFINYLLHQKIAILGSPGFTEMLCPYFLLLQILNTKS